MTAGIAYVSLEAVAAQSVPGYRYAENYISDLGRPDTPLNHLMNAAFVVQGVLFLAAALLLVRARRPRARRVFVGCAAANAVGNVVVAAVPSGPSGIAWVHATAAVLAIVGGNAAILAGWRLVNAAGWYRWVSVGVAVLGLVSFGLLAVASMTSALPLAAVWERTAVYTIIGWQVLSALVLVTKTARRE